MEPINFNRLTPYVLEPEFTSSRHRSLKSLQTKAFRKNQGRDLIVDLIEKPGSEIGGRSFIVHTYCRLKFQQKLLTAIGIDLGLKDFATCSDGTTLVVRQLYRQLEENLGKAQRANKKARVRSIHAKIRNRRKDAIHKFTTALANNHAAIFVGDVSSSKLAKTKMAKSVLDAGWAMLKTQLEYKAIGRSVVYEVVNEAYSTRACSCCGVIPDSSPKGRAGLRIEGAAQVMDLFRVRN